MSTLNYEVGSRAVKALHQENYGIRRYRVLSIVLRWYDQFCR